MREVTLTRKQAPRSTAAPSLLSAVFVLVLGAWIHPVLAATTADARCDSPADTLPMSIADENKLAIRVLGHGTPASATPDAVVLDDTVIETLPNDSGSPAGPRVDIILRRIIDEAQLRQPKLPKPEQAGNLGPPLAGDKSETVEESATLPETSPVDAVQERPRFPADDLLRYRQQMYRTDI
jgi:hypothetical protein